MTNPFLRSMVSVVNGITTRQSRSYVIDRRAFDPTKGGDLELHGLGALAAALTTPSTGLQTTTASQLQAFALEQLQRATGGALYLDNIQTMGLYAQGHCYVYRSPRLALSPEAVTYISDNVNNAMRLSVRTFANGALELPEGTVMRMREQMQQGASDGVLFRELRHDPTIIAYQQQRWEAQETLVGDVMLGHNSIIRNTRQERYLLEDNSIVVDLINPATREFHTLDGSSIWLRMVDTVKRQLVFAVIGTGKHRHALIDAANIWGGMGIWHYMALIQQSLYDAVPRTHENIASHIASTLQTSDPVARKIHQTVSGNDNDRVGAFLRGLRRQHAYEIGDLSPRPALVSS